MVFLNLEYIHLSIYLSIYLYILLSLSLYLSIYIGNVSVCGQEVGQVDWAEPEHEVDEETMSSVKILFVR